MTGVEAAVNSFVRTLEYEDVVVVSASEPAPTQNTGEQLGHAELVDVVLTVAQGMAGQAAFEVLRNALTKLRHRESDLKIEEISGNDDIATPLASDKND